MTKSEIFLRVSVVQDVVQRERKAYLVTACYVGQDEKKFGSLGNLTEQQYRKVLAGSKVTEEQLNVPIRNGQNCKLGGDGLFFSEKELAEIGILPGQDRGYRE